MITPTQPTNSGSNHSKRSSKAPAQSLNHLLNFTLPPRQSHHIANIPRKARKTSNHHGVWNKERFVNAQYRFNMNPNGDYTVHFADPDIYFQWHDILQIIIPRAHSLSASPEEQLLKDDESMTCPICLSTLNAPRMTKCGHVFCFPCILHLLSTSDQLKWVRCPICFDSVNERQLKAVKWLDKIPGSVEVEVDDGPMEGSSSSTSLDHDIFTTSHPGSTLRMRLIQRPQITTLALPRSTTWPSDLLPPHQAPFHFLPDAFGFAKFMLATPSDLIKDLTNDLDDLAMERRSLAGMGDELSVVFVDAADAKVRHQIEKAATLETPYLREAIETARHAIEQLKSHSANDRQRRDDIPQVSLPSEDIPQAFLATQSPAFAVSQPTRESTPTPTSGRNPRQRRNVNPPPSTSSYYYYQAANGLPIFLHPLEIKILLAHYQSYAAFPNEITVHVESHQESTVNDDLRKRCKYLAHLPEGADVVFVEADLSGVVGAHGLRAFENALRLRRTKRKEKGRKDDKARARAEEREKEKLVHTWIESRYPPSVPSGFESAREPSPFDTRASDDAEEEVSAPQPASTWGPRSFASAAHAAQGRPQGQRAPAARAREPEEDWHLEDAIHELEQRSTKGGKKRNNRLVVLGGGGGRRAR